MANFRWGSYGRMEWTRDGRDYHLQMFAPTFAQSLEPEKMLARSCAQSQPTCECSEGNACAWPPMIMRPPRCA